MQYEFPSETPEVSSAIESSVRAVQVEVLESPWRRGATSGEVRVRCDGAERRYALSGVGEEYRRQPNGKSAQKRESSHTTIGWVLSVCQGVLRTGGVVE